MRSLQILSEELIHRARMQAKGEDALCRYTWEDLLDSHESLRHEFEALKARHEKLERKINAKAHKCKCGGG